MSSSVEIAERRRYPRTQLQMSLQAIRLDPDDCDVVDVLHTIDISKSGIGVYSDRSYYPGQRVVLSLPVRGSDDRKNLSATVVSCKRQRDDYRVGMCFDSEFAGLSGDAREKLQAA